MMLHLCWGYPLTIPNQVLKDVLSPSHLDRVASTGNQDKVMTIYQKHSVNITQICCEGGKVYL